MSSILPRPGAAEFGDPIRLRVLVVDNDPTIARVVERILGSPHDLRACVDPEEALALLVCGARFDVILCDLLMPRLSGPAFYARTREIDPLLAPRIVFITGGASLPESQVFLGSIPNPVLEKPFTRAALRDIVRDVARTNRLGEAKCFTR